MSDLDRLAARHSPEFVERWLEAYCACYGWRRDGWFAVVPGLPGRRTWACAPGLAYTHLTPAEAAREAERVAERPFQVRVIDPADAAPEEGDPVVLRMDLAARGHDLDRVLREDVGRTTRNLVRRAGRDGLRAEVGSDRERRTAFRRLLAGTMHGHGAPMPPARLFDRITEAVACHVVLVRDARGAPVATVMGVADPPILWSPWAAIAPTPPPGAGELAWWRFVALAGETGCDLVDFGRSPFASGPYRFKRKFGSVPVALRRLSNRPASLYARYALAQRVWRRLPSSLTDVLGPRLCARLADY